MTFHTIKKPSDIRTVPAAMIVPGMIIAEGLILETDLQQSRVTSRSILWMRTPMANVHTPWGSGKVEVYGQIIDKDMLEQARKTYSSHV